MRMRHGAMTRQFWVSFPSRFGWMTVKVEVRRGVVFESYTALVEFEGKPWAVAEAALRAKFGDSLRIEELL